MMKRDDVLNEIAEDLQDPEAILRAIGAVESAELRPPGGTAADATPPSTPEEQALVEIWREALRRDAVGVHQDFFAIGGNSILGVQVMARVQRVFGQDVPLRVLFAAPTIARLARAIAQEAGAAALPPLTPRRRAGAARASFAQQRLWFVAEMEPASPAYAVAVALRLRGALDVAALEWSLSQIVARHEVLRTHFEMVGGELCQVVEQPWRVQLCEEDLRAEPADEWQRRAQAEARRPFDLARLPLMRVRLLRTGEREWVLCTVLHHIVSDGWSLGVLESELCRTYSARCQGRAPELAALPIQYGDWAEWHRDVLTPERLGPQLAWWRQRLGHGARRVWSAVADPERAGCAGQLATALGPEATEALRALGRREGATLHMVLAAGVAAALYRFTGQEEIRLGTPVAGRGAREAEGLIGLFVNTLVVPVRVNGDDAFATLLRDVKEALLGGYERQDVPYEKVVEALRESESAAGDGPLFDALFALQNAPRPAADPAGFEVTREDVRTGAARFPLSLWAFESGGGLVFDSEYDEGRFDRASVQALFDGLRTLLEHVGARPETSVLDVPLGGDEGAGGESARVAADRDARFGA